VTAAERWREQLAALAIPDEIVTAAPETPWGYSTELFRARAEGAIATEPTPTTMRAFEALPEGGVVLDVGVGGGATSLPLAARAGTIVGVDGQADMLEEFRAAAGAAGVRARTVLGTWPDVSDQVETADVAVSGHVAYNVPALGPFAEALDAHARYRVVLELTERHPLAWMNDLWLHFHDLARPDGPTVEDARSVLAEIGIEAHREDRIIDARNDGGGGFVRREDAIHLVRKRLCLGAEHDEEIAAKLGSDLRQVRGVWDVGPPERTIVTLWWDTAV
jgi:2-polyprenyl-3-methyl-5-hydroxy-6-metoxy-1,4-benzoquinol methylase